jgi:hypothetical protein
MLSPECQRNNSRKQTAPHPQKAWGRVVVDIAVAAAAAAAHAHP